VSEAPSGRRAELESRLAQWLDEALADEPPPDGVAAEVLAELGRPGGGVGRAAAATDLYSAWSAVTALTQEVKLQGRAFDRLTDGLSGHTAGEPAAEGPGRLRQPPPDPEPEPGRREEWLREGEERGRGEVLEVLLDVRDRLQRGHETARGQLRAAHEALARAGPGGEEQATLRREVLAAADAMERGYAMSLQRVEEQLWAQGVSEIPCAGRRFDPRRMRAVDVELRPELTDGAVLEVVRPGYQQRGEILRYAEVKVARSQERL